MLSDSQLLSLQTVVMNWIKHKGCIDFQRSRKAIEDAAMSLSIDLTDLSNAEYSIIYPLYQVGILEYGKTEKGVKLFPCSSDIHADDCNWRYSPEFELPRYKKEEKEANGSSSSGDSYFRALPSIKTCIMNWREQHVANFRVTYDLRKHTFKYITDKESGCGIYKQSDESWVDSYCRIGDNDYLIPQYSENPEAFRIAKSYLMAANGIRLFEYSGRQLKCLYYADLPIPIIRGLLISSPGNLENEKVYRYCYQMEFENISGNIVRQLERIFSITVI